MMIDLFDPGEGASKLEILDPNGNAVNFDWTTPCGSVGGKTIAAPSGTTCNTTTKTAGANNVAFLDVSGTGTQPYGNLSSNSKYSDRKVSAFVKLPIELHQPVRHQDLVEDPLHDDQQRRHRPDDLVRQHPR